MKGAVVVTATRHAGETWTVRVVYPDGSTAHHRGVVDYGHAGDIAARAFSKAEDMLTNKFSPLAGDGGGAIDTTEDCPAGGTHAHIRHAKGRCIKCGRVAGDGGGA